jgi:RNA polymerase sigma factor (sigma-70 family)
MAGGGFGWTPTFEEHRDMLLAYAQRQLVGTGLDANDFVQDTIERGLRVFATRPPPIRADAWLMKVLRNLLISDFRRRLARKRVEDDPSFTLEPIASLEDELDPVPLTKMAAVLEELTVEAFAEAVQSLSPKLREAYELHMEGTSNPEIARELSLTASAVAKRLHDARKQLRALLSSVAKEHES